MMYGWIPYENSIFHMCIQYMNINGYHSYNMDPYHNMCILAYAYNMCIGVHKFYVDGR